MAIILISHRTPDVFAVCDRVMVMRRGEQGRRQFDQGDQPGRSDRLDHRRHPHGLRGARQPPPTAAATGQCVDRIGAGPPATQLERFTGAGVLGDGCRSIIVLVMSVLEPSTFATADNFYNTTRNFSFIGIIALGMTAVIATEGSTSPLDRSWVSTAVSCGPHARSWLFLLGGCDRRFGRGGVVGLINGLIIAYLGLSPSSRRSACWRSRGRSRWCCRETRMIYKIRLQRPGLQGAGQRLVEHHFESARLSAPFPHPVHIHPGGCLQNDELGSSRSGDRR